MGAEGSGRGKGVGEGGRRRKERGMWWRSGRETFSFYFMTSEVAALSQAVHLEYKKQINQKMSKQTMEVKC